MSNDANERITALALKQFTAVLCESREFQWSPASGTPPSKAYIEHKPFSKTPWANETATEAWSIENCDIITKIEPLPKLPKLQVDRMFYDCMLGNWGVSADEKQLSINWQLGPLYGRGFVFPLIESPSGIIYLGDSKPTWVS